MTKRLLPDQDPDYENIAVEAQQKRLRLLEQDAKEATVRRIEKIIRAQFGQEIFHKEAELETVDRSLLQTRAMLDRLRACVVAKYYATAGQMECDKIKSEQKASIGLHPTVKKFLGKAPVSNFGDQARNPIIKEEAESSYCELQNSAERWMASSTIRDISRKVLFEGEKQHTLVQEEPPGSIHSVRLKQKCRIVVGNVSKFIPTSQRDEADQSTHKWMVYVRGSKEEPHIDHVVKKVLFFLHPSYRPNDLVEVSDAPFRLTRRGWGEFPVRIQLHFHDQRNKPVDVIHHLKLDKTFTGLQTLGAETVVDIWLFKQETVIAGTSIITTKPTICKEMQMKNSEEHADENSKSKGASPVTDINCQKTRNVTDFSQTEFILHADDPLSSLKLQPITLSIPDLASPEVFRLGINMALGDAVTSQSLSAMLKNTGGLLPTSPAISTQDASCREVSASPQPVSPNYVQLLDRAPLPSHQKSCRELTLNSNTSESPPELKTSTSEQEGPLLSIPPMSSPVHLESNLNQQRDSEVASSSPLLCMLSQEDTPNGQICDTSLNAQDRLDSGRNLQPSQDIVSSASSVSSTLISQVSSKALQNANAQSGPTTGLLNNAVSLLHCKSVGASPNKASRISPNAILPATSIANKNTVLLLIKSASSSQTTPLGAGENSLPLGSSVASVSSLLSPKTSSASTRCRTPSPKGAFPEVNVTSKKSFTLTGGTSLLTTSHKSTSKSVATMTSLASHTQLRTASRSPLVMVTSQPTTKVIAQGGTHTVTSTSTVSSTGAIASTSLGQLTSVSTQPTSTGGLGSQPTPSANGLTVFVKCIDSRGRVILLPASSLAKMKLPTEMDRTSSTGTSAASKPAMQPTPLGDRLPLLSVCQSQVATLQQSKSSIPIEMSSCIPSCKAASVPSYSVRVVPTTSGSPSQVIMIPLGDAAKKETTDSSQPVTPEKPKLKTSEASAQRVKGQELKPSKNLTTSWDASGRAYGKVQKEEPPCSAQILLATLPTSANHSSLQDIVKWVVQHYPLVAPQADRSHHPYCAPSLEVFLSWNIGKQRASERLRASAVRKVIMQMLRLTTPTRWSSSDMWTTRQLMVWCRKYGYTPFRPGPSLPVPQKFSLGNLSTCTTPDTLVKELSQEEERLRKLIVIEQKDEVIDVTSVDDRDRDTCKKLQRFDKASHDKGMEYLPLSSMAVEFVREKAAEIGVALPPEEVAPSIAASVVGEMIFAVCREFTRDLLRIALSKAFDRVGGKCCPDSIVVQDVFCGIQDLPTGDFLTLKYLGVAIAQESFVESNQSL